VIIFVFRDRLAAAARFVGREFRNRQVEARGPGGTGVTFRDRITKDEIKEEAAEATAEFTTSKGESRADGDPSEPSTDGDAAEEIAWRIRLFLLGIPSVGGTFHALARSDVIIFEDEDGVEVARGAPMYPADALLLVHMFISEARGWPPDSDVWRSAVAALRSTGVPVSEMSAMGTETIHKIRDAQTIEAHRYDFPTQPVPQN
jgi:hypothetical protein